MFQFPGFPAHTYGFSIRFVILHHEGFPIRISADQCLFTTPRSFSQLVTSFFGSQCQGIHLMLFFAWTVFFLVLFIAWASLQLIVWVASNYSRSCWHFFLTTFQWQNCSFPLLLERPSLISWSLKIFAQLSVRLLACYLFSFQWSFPPAYPGFAGLNFRCSPPLARLWW